MDISYHHNCGTADIYGILLPGLGRRFVLYSKNEWTMFFLAVNNEIINQRSSPQSTVIKRLLRKIVSLAQFLIGQYSHFQPSFLLGEIRVKHPF